jgi:hypothetical protein
MIVAAGASFRADSYILPAPHPGWPFDDGYSGQGSVTKPCVAASNRVP